MVGKNRTLFTYEFYCNAIYATILQLFGAYIHRFWINFLYLIAFEVSGKLHEALFFSHLNILYRKFVEIKIGSK